MRYLFTLTIALTACATTPPPREAPRKVAAQESPWAEATFGFTIGLLVMGVVWNFMPSGNDK